MTSAADLVWFGAACVVTGVLLLRRAWGLAHRSHVLNTVAWGLILSGALWGVAGHGAWGMAVTALFGMVAASPLLAYAAICSPAGKARAANRRVHMLPEPGEPMRLAARVLTFLITVPGALLSAMVLAIGARAAVSAIGWAEADANVLALLVMPVAWAALLVLLLMAPNRRSQLARLALPIVAAAMLSLIGAIAR